MRDLMQASVYLLIWDCATVNKCSMGYYGSDKEDEWTQMSFILKMESEMMAYQYHAMYITAKKEAGTLCNVDNVQNQFL